MPLRDFVEMAFQIVFSGVTDSVVDGLQKRKRRGAGRLFVAMVVIGALLLFLFWLFGGK